MNRLERTYGQDDEISSPRQSNSEIKDSISDILVQNPYEIKLNTLGISLGDLGSRDKDGFLLNENLVYSDGGTKYILINGKKYFIVERHDDKEGMVYKTGYMWDLDKGLSPFFFVGTFSKINGDGVLVKKDGEIYEGNFVISGIRRIRYDGRLRFPNGDIYEGDFIDGKPITEKSEEFSPFKKKGTYIKLNGDKKTYRYYGKVMGRPYFVKLKDNKADEDWANNRGNVISIIEEAKGQPTKGKLSSWGHTTEYIETDSEYIFQTQNGKELIIHKDKSDNKDREISNIINAIKYFYEEHNGKIFFVLGDDLKYRYGKLGILFSTLLSNVSEKIGNSDYIDRDVNTEASNSGSLWKRFEKNKKETAKNLAKWLNCYYKPEVG